MPPIQTAHLRALFRLLDGAHSCIIRDLVPRTVPYAFHHSAAAGRVTPAAPSIHKPCPGSFPPLFDRPQRKTSPRRQALLPGDRRIQRPIFPGFQTAAEKPAAIPAKRFLPRAAFLSPGKTPDYRRAEQSKQLKSTPPPAGAFVSTGRCCAGAARAPLPSPTGGWKEESSAFSRSCSAPFPF